ncbi:hypothetical protein NUW58_g4026 [Xylaria curta]|uniref:Uncharacterized protein n=1 Tax=Xylaria curta TaxID=42375 RepID=A0ACC1P956_9PEZI|nr:hypothetical protein NUW58_g4026 [Xylaria curta]
MSDRSDRDDDQHSDIGGDQHSDIDDGMSTERESNESETDQGDGFFDLEAEETDGYNDDDDDDIDDDHYSFPQFPRLPLELRIMIWEALDPDLKSKARIFDFGVVEDAQHEIDLWESATLEQQTAPARALLTTNRESRRIALAYYPDVITLRHGYGIRFNSANDIILLHLLRDFDHDITLGPWCDKISNIAFYYSDSGPFSPTHPLNIVDRVAHYCSNLKTVFHCYEAGNFGHHKLGWSVAESSRQFYLETFEEEYGLGEDFKALYCWPDTTLHADFAESVDVSYTLDFPSMPKVRSVPIWPMAHYAFDSGLAYYDKVKCYYERNVGRDDDAESEWSGSYPYEIEQNDDYELDDFVVDSSSEGGDEASDEEDDDVDVHRPDGLSVHEISSDGDGDEHGAGFGQDPDTFDGFSPLQDPSDDEVNGNLPNATSVVYDVGSSEGHASDAPSPEEQLRAARSSGRRKRRIVSSDDEGGDEDGDVPAIENHSRVSKRARFASLDIEDDEDGSGNGATFEVEESSRPKKRAFVVLSDSEDEEDDVRNHRERRRRPGHDFDDDGDENDEESEEESDGEDEQESPASKPVSLLARLRQFRSDVPVSPEGGSPNSAEDYDEDEEVYAEQEERAFSEVEFPESAEEDGDEDGW